MLSFTRAIDRVRGGLFAAGSWAQGHQRLAEIDLELHAQTFRPSAGGVFAESFRKLVGGVLVLDLMVCAGSVIDHWVSEADSAKARAPRVTDLQAERDALTATSRPSRP